MALVNSPKKTTEKSSNKDAKFGTFKGVFTPSVLTILGVIMYLRFGWVVGNGGLLGAIMVVLLAHAISVTTGMSICSIATNRTVKAGGDYYMISRSLGLPVGGAIGIALFFALALSMSLYLIGFAESFLDTFGIENTLNARRIVATVACLALTALTFFSTSAALRIQYFVLAAILLSLASLFMGGTDTQAAAAGSGGMRLWFVEGSESFETLFAVFFPAVTGFTAGVAMSGDLKDSRSSIPRGTMGAILFGLAVYLIIPVFLYYNADSEGLRDDNMILFKLARVSQLVVAGVFAATLSSALGSVLGAPRYLQALALDGVVPGFLGKGYGALNEPRVGTIVTFIIAEAGIIVGELDVIARIITMFFLSSYGVLNLACAIQAWSGIPSFRPDFKTPTWVSLTGALVCLGVMFKLDTVAMVGASLVMGAIYFLLKRRQFRASPGDTWGGFWSAVVQEGILHLHRRSVDSRNWRPNAIVFGGPPREREYLIHLSRWIVHNRGLSTYFHLVEGDIRIEIDRARRLESSIRDTVGREYPQMLTRVSVCQDIYEGIRNVSQSYGLAGMIPNSILLGWAEHSERPAQFTELICDLLALNHNLLLIRHDDVIGFGKHHTIDIWWGGLERNGAMMLLLAYLITSSEIWARPEVRINVVVDDEQTYKNTFKSLRKVIADSRVRAESNIILRKPTDRPIAEIITECSADRDLVIMGLRPPGGDEKEAFVERINDFLANLGTVLLVRASTHFDGTRLLFDDE